MRRTVLELENAYVESASELRAAQVNLLNYADELEDILRIKDELTQHPDFSGVLPITFYECE